MTNRTRREAGPGLELNDPGPVGGERKPERDDARPARRDHEAERHDAGPRSDRGPMRPDRGPMRRDPGPVLPRRPPRSDSDDDSVRLGSPGAAGTPVWDRQQLERRVDARISARHLSPKTRSTYLGWIRRYLAHYGKQNPAALGLVDIERYLEHLAEDLRLGSESQNQAASSIVFMYREVFGIDLGGPKGVRRAKAGRVLPKYAAPEDVDRLLACLTGPARVAATIMYGSGTRIAETTAIRIKDLSLGNRELIVRSGKGAKDRTTVIPRGALEAIRDQMETVEEQHVLDLEAGGGWARLPAALHRKDPRAGWTFAWQFLFPSARTSVDPKTGHRGRLPVHNTTFQKAVKKAARASGIHKPISCHVLRHCFATEMLRSGCEIRTLQRVMGHNDLKTTARYLHILDRPGLSITSPFDRLPSVQRALYLSDQE